MNPMNQRNVASLKVEGNSFNFFLIFCIVIGSIDNSKLKQEGVRIFCSQSIEVR